MVCEFQSVQELVNHVEKEAWKRARKILEGNDVRLSQKLVSVVPENAEKVIAI